MNIKSILKGFEERYDTGGVSYPEGAKRSEVIDIEDAKSLLQEKLEAIFGEIQEEIMKARPMESQTFYLEGLRDGFKRAATIIETKK